MLKPELEERFVLAIQASSSQTGLVKDPDSAAIAIINEF